MRSRHHKLPVALCVASVALAGAIACSRSDSPTPPASDSPTPTAASPAPDAPARLAYFAESGGAFELRLVEARSGRSETLDSLTSAPVAVAWSLDAPSVVTLSADGAYRIDYAKPPYSSVPIGEAAPAGVDVVDLWLDDSGTALRAVGWSAAKSACTLFGVPEAGAWVSLEEQVASEVDSFGPPCGAFADARRGARSLSSAKLMQQYQCASSQDLCDSDPTKALDSIDREAIRKANPSFDSIALIRAEAGASAAALGIGVGDTPHLLQPLYLWDKAGDGPKRIELPTAAQVQVGVAGPLLLVAEEYTGNDPVVVDLSLGTLIFQAHASGAVWVPYPVD